MTLTGRARYRVTRWRRRLVLQLEVYERYMDPVGGTGYFDTGTRKLWRDARPEDVLPSAYTLADTACAGKEVE